MIMPVHGEVKLNSIQVITVHMAPVLLLLRCFLRVKLLGIIYVFLR